MPDLEGLRVNLILEQIAHHAKVTSPDYIVNYIQYNHLFHRGYAPWRFITPRVIANYFTKRSGMRCYTYDQFVTESYVILKKIFSKGEIYHFNNGNDSYRFAGLLKQRGNKVIATYHQPPGVMHRFVTGTDHIKNLDTVLVVGSNQIKYFEQFLPADKIFKISLATDTSFFKPEKRVSNGRTCLFTGQWLRDFDTLKGVIEHINREDKTIRFKIITHKTNWNLFSGLENTEMLTGLSDEQLRDQYQNADLFLLPLLDCTGNCALIEAMASGLPVITNDVGGVRDYVNEECAVILKKGDIHSMAEAVLELFGNDKRLKRMSEASREKAVSEFEWSTAAEKIAGIYRAI